MARALSLAIVGADYPNKRGPTRWFEINLCKPGEPLELRPEPNNPADEWAMAVFSCRNVQLGYLPSERAVLVTKWLRDGREVAAVFQARSTFGAWLRLGLDGEVPTVDPNPPEPAQRSAPRERVDEDHGFEPDPTYED